MDETQGRRSVSPYHEKCFPPYCDNAHQVDKTMVSKMPRGDLEDKYITYADENLDLKKQNKNLERQVQRLQTAIQRQDRLDKRSGSTPTSMVADSNKLAVLEAQNKNLQAKVKVLKQQLMNHSYLHCKEGRINEAKVRQSLMLQGRNPGEPEFQYPCAEVPLPGSARSSTTSKTDKNVEALKKRISDLEKQLEAQKNKYKDRIEQLEKELSALEKEAGKSGTSVQEQLSSTSRQVKDNTELIKLRMQAEKQAQDLEEMMDKLKAAEEDIEKLQMDLKFAKDRADALEDQVEKERNRSRSAISQTSGHRETIRALEEQVRDLKNERDALKEANEKLLEVTQARASQVSSHSIKIAQLEKDLKDKMDEIEEKEAKIRELEGSVGSDFEPRRLYNPRNPFRGQPEPENLTLKNYWRNVKIHEAVLDTNRQLLQEPEPCANCEELSKQVTQAQEESARLKDQLERALAEAERPKTPPPSENSGELDQLREEVEALKKEIDQLKAENAELQDELAKQRAIAEREKSKSLSGASSYSSAAKADKAKMDDMQKTMLRLERELEEANQELEDLRPIAEEYKNCRNEKSDTISKSAQYEPVPSVVSFNVPDDVKVVDSKEHPSEDSVHSKKTIESERYIALQRQLEQALEENEKLRKELDGRDGDDALKRQNQRLSDELSRALQELKEVKPIADEHINTCVGHKSHPPSVRSLAKTPVESHHTRQQTPSHHSRASSPPPETRQQTQVPSHYSVKEGRNKKWPDAEKIVSFGRRRKVQSESSEWKLLDELLNMVDDEDLRDDIPDAQPKNHNSPEKENPETLLKNNDRKKGGSSKLQLQSAGRVNEEEAKSLQKFNSGDFEDFKEDSKKNDEVQASNSKDFTPHLEDGSGDLKKPLLTPTLVNVKRLLRRRTTLHSAAVSRSVEESSPVKEEEEAQNQRPGYQSHVTPPPSEHCAQTVDPDQEQKANLLIVSKHDFETVLMQKKKYSAEVEVVEPVDGRQSLNCKLEICMYDLEMEDRMLEWLQSIQPEPRVYVEWSFVGLDQRTSPMPAQQALFYTNVMYYGPLSGEIKHYLGKVEMPVDLYLVRSNATPLKVAEGTLDMLPAMEQPNRGFMRSVFLRGKDMPGRYATDRPAATIHCSFILHECCLGDPPFRDQLEVAIGTLYLKNRDGGVVPDHATHIYIEYALLGHCGPDLETDSVPRGEVMKFNHSKKLRVNDDNAPHLKAMLEDQNPKMLRFTVLAEPCSLTTDTEVETVGHADINLNEEMIRKDRDLISSQVPVYSNDGEHLGSLSVTVLGIGTLQQIYRDAELRPAGGGGGGPAVGPADRHSLADRKSLADRRSVADRHSLAGQSTTTRHTT